MLFHNWDDPVLYWHRHRHQIPRYQIVCLQDWSDKRQATIVAPLLISPLTTWTTLIVDKKRHHSSTGIPLIVDKTEHHKVLLKGIISCVSHFMWGCWTNGKMQFFRRNFVFLHLRAPNLIEHFISLVLVIEHLLQRARSPKEWGCQFPFNLKFKWR